MDKIICHEQIKKIFNQIDSDKDKKISKNEFKFLFQNNNLLEKIYEQEIVNFDEDQDGNLDFIEFEKMMMQVINNKNK